MAKTKNRRVVFLPIKPEFAHKIINGEKNIEFRKKFSSQEVETIVIYSSSPEKRVIGYATVDSIVIDTPDSLWKRFYKKGGIDKDRFSFYFNGKETGVGIRIKNVSRLKEALPLLSWESKERFRRTLSFWKKGLLRY
ncbi:ASCH domain protein [Leptospira interrogans serovar Pomona str. Kennewicki LC82-25]|uniref:ASCH domain protein n=1 Tax=Leptospira interrogans str. UI 12621 TaxID=1049937 RepID=A0A0F6HE96_LEPIR|nr:ASCH domain protein [Leptospira interrogans serovar Pomona str. Kennewicki LC82-25]EKN97065.1 ASCH domain protein [Leptospira interrogans serovar Pomona str. Pomona]EKO26661.1 ASCH domain protein [Leptospira interrogans str. UI 12621]EMF34751.1 ASCH domain protein [Leptospira interrogans serovar Pomona str. Fox 32256]EMI66341.1 ASCH domain protein [Leptospira interrogans serovar Pomona str. CSL10083]EMJ65696.1 ASCH domain protein [Leptospira interrogans serovar Pomona str. CSL4002]EMO01823